MKRLPTFEEKKLEDCSCYIDRQNTLWNKEIKNKCKHDWKPVHLKFNTDANIPESLTNAKVYRICVKCCSYTYIEAGFAGFYINSPDILEELLIEKEV